IDIDVTADEAQEINNILFSEVNQLMGDDQWADFLEIIDGIMHLNGKQALSYARIRYVGNSDFERTSRQREVITKIIPKIVNPVSVSRIVKNVVPKVNTNMSSLGMYFLSLKVPFSIGYDIEQIQIPAENTFYPEDVWCDDGTTQSVLQVDFNANYNILEDTIFSH
ncbi:MAG: LCP family protein, partial [Ruminococcus sp.]|nr:LCP family protein [Ruminococcus sp.]